MKVKNYLWVAVFVAVTFVACKDDSHDVTPPATGEELYADDKCWFQTGREMTLNCRMCSM